MIARPTTCRHTWHWVETRYRVGYWECRRCLVASETGEHDVVAKEPQQPPATVCTPPPAAVGHCGRVETAPDPHSAGTSPATATSRPAPSNSKESGEIPGKDQRVAAPEPAEWKAAGLACSSPPIAGEP